MRRMKATVYLLIGAMLALLIGVAALELMFGSWFSDDPWRSLERINLQRNVHRTFNSEALYGSAMPTVTYTRDAYGLRGQCEDPRSIEILTVGGSTTDQLFIPDGQTFQDVLQGLLRNDLGRRVCLANAGVDGHSTFAHIEALDHWFPIIPGLKPKYFLLYIGINDAGIRLSPQLDFDLNRKIVEAPLSYALSQHSALYGLGRTLKRLIQGNQGNQFAWHNQNRPKADQYTATQTAPDIDDLVKRNTAAFARRLDTIVSTITTRYGAKPICVSQPNLFAIERDGRSVGLPEIFTYDGRKFNGLDYQRSILSINAAMKEICTSAGGYYFDMGSVVFPVTDFYDAVHMGPAGAQALGTHLFDEMQRQGIVDALRNQRAPAP